MTAPARINPVWPLLLRAARCADAPVEAAGRAVSWLFLPMIAIIVFDALSRRVLRKLDVLIDWGVVEYLNSPVLQDAEWHLHAIIFLAALGYAYNRNAHVRLDIWRGRFGVTGRLWLEFLGGLLLLAPFLLVLTNHSWDFFLRAWETDEGSGAANGIEDRWIIKFFVFAGPTLLALSAVSMLLRLAVRLFGPAELAARARTRPIEDASYSAFE